MTWVLLILVVMGGDVVQSPLEKFASIETCLEGKAFVEKEMAKAYPEDHTTQFVCWPVRGK